MAGITELIKNIRNEIYGKDVRESIASAIEKTYEDAAEQGNANMEVSEARGTFNTLNNRLNNSDNVKADKTEVESEVEARKNADSNLQSQVNSLASGSPLVASSVAEMTDTSKVYVNTTDGHWYTYNGTSWVVGGIYQSAGITDNSINYEKINQNVFNNSYLVNAEEITESGTAECAVALFYDLTPLGIKSQYKVDINFNIRPNNNIINQVLARARLISDTLISGDYKSLNLDEINYTDELIVTRSDTNYNLGLLVYIYPTLLSRSPSSYYIKNLSLFIDDIEFFPKDIKLFTATGTVKQIQITDKNNYENIQNYYNEKNITKNNYFNQNDNKIILQNVLYTSFNTYQNDDRFDTVVIPVQPNSNYLFKYESLDYTSETTGNFGICKNENETTALKGENLTSQDGGVIVPIIDGYLLIKSIRKSQFISDWKNTLTVTKIKNNSASQYISELNNIPLHDEELREIYNNNSIKHLNNHLYNKNLLIIGDSISDNSLTQYANKYYFDYLKENEKMNLILDGQSGTGYTMGDSGELDFIGRINNYSGYNPDYISIFGGTNDWFNAENNNIQMGTISDTPSDDTFAGKVKATILKLFEKYPSASILIATPIMRNRGVNYNGKLVNSITEGYQNTLEEYANLLKKIGNSYGIPVIDLYHESMLNPTIESNRIYYFTKPDKTVDNTHPNNDGQLKLYYKFKEGLLRA